jgi:hypothetical protein
VGVTPVTVRSEQKIVCKFSVSPKVLSFPWGIRQMTERSFAEDCGINIEEKIELGPFLRSDSRERRQSARRNRHHPTTKTSSKRTHSRPNAL